MQKSSFLVSVACYLFWAGLFCCLVAGCAEEEKKSLYPEAALVRVIHLAPNLSSGTPHFALPLPDDNSAPGERRAVAAELGYTGYTGAYFFAPAGLTEVEFETSEGTLSREFSFSAGGVYFVMMVENAGEVGLEQVEVYTHPGAHEAVQKAPDTEARVGIFHAAAALGPLTLTFEREGAEPVEWSLSFGDSDLLTPKVLPPGHYGLTVDTAGDQALITPGFVTLEASTITRIFVNPPFEEGTDPQLLFVVDGPDHFPVQERL